MNLVDIQSGGDDRGIELEAVGVSGLRYPVQVRQVVGGLHASVATFAMSVVLPAHQKGSHLSRFVEELESFSGVLDTRTLVQLGRRLLQRLDTPEATITASFPYFLRRLGPVSGAGALMDYDCELSVRVNTTSTAVTIQVTVPVTSVCPCSKAISDYGAHNQRGTIRIDAELSPSFDPEEFTPDIDLLINVAESSASSPVLPLLKRSDERHVTMQGYDNPVFVEDMVRGVVEKLRTTPWITRFTVEATNDESIHNHAAFARATWPSCDKPA